MITVILNDKSVINIDECIILQSTIDSVLKDCLNNSVNTGDPIALNINILEFSHIYYCHANNVKRLIRPTYISDILWKYIGLELPKRTYTQMDYVNYFTQSLIVDGKLDTSCGYINVEKDKLVNMYGTSDKYFLCYIVEIITMPIVKDVDSEWWSYDKYDSGLKIKCKYTRFSINNSVCINPNIHMEPFNELMKKLVGEDNFVRDERLEEAFLAQFK